METVVSDDELRVPLGLDAGQDMVPTEPANRGPLGQAVVGARTRGGELVVGEDPSDRRRQQELQQGVVLRGALPLDHEDDRIAVRAIVRPDQVELSRTRRAAREHPWQQVDRGLRGAVPRRAGDRRTIHRSDGVAVQGGQTVLTEALPDRGEEPRPNVFVVVRQANARLPDRIEQILQTARRRASVQRPSLDQHDLGIDSQDVVGAVWIDERGGIGEPGQARNGDHLLEGAGAHEPLHDLRAAERPGREVDTDVGDLVDVGGSGDVADGAGTFHMLAADIGHEAAVALAGRLEMLAFELVDGGLKAVLHGAGNLDLEVDPAWLAVPVQQVGNANRLGHAASFAPWAGSQCDPSGLQYGRGAPDRPLSRGD